MKTYDIVMVGHFSKDIIDVKGCRFASKGGGIYYASYVISKLGFKSAVITRISQSDVKLLDDLRALGIDLYISYSNSTSSIENIYLPDMNGRITRLISFAGPFSIRDIPDNIKWDTLMVIPVIAGEVNLELLRYLRKRTNGTLALDIQGFIRVPERSNLVYKPLEDEIKEEILSLVDILKMDDVESRVLTGYKDIRKAALSIANYGVKEVVITSKEGLLVYAYGTFYNYRWTAKKLDGRTGRGDTCFASYVALRKVTEADIAAKIASEITSRKIEVPGPFKGELPPETLRVIGLTIKSRQRHNMYR